MQGRELRSAWVGHRTRPFVGVQVDGLMRYALYGALLVASLMFYVWSRVDVRASAAALEGAQAELSQLHADQDRLRLELAVRHDLAGVATASEALGLVQEVAVVEVVTP